MTEPESSLPIVAPELIQWCSPVRLDVEIGGHTARVHGVIVSIDPGRREARVATTGAGLVWRSFADIALDLTDATGRVHAAWWLANQPCVDTWPGGYHHLDTVLGEGHCFSVAAAEEGEPMTPEDIACLRRVALHVAGIETGRQRAASE